MEKVSKKARILCAWALMWACNYILPPWYERAFQPPEAARCKLDVLLDVIGESRTVLARFLWFKADLYHEMLSRQGVSVFNERDAIPLLRMVTYLDPHLDDAFDVLAWDMIKGYNDPRRSLEILEDGLGYNPKSYRLAFRKAMVLHHLKRYSEAIPAGEVALRCADEEVDVLNACRVLYACYDHEKLPDDALRILDIWLGLRPTDSRPLGEKAKILQRREASR